LLANCNATESAAAGRLQHLAPAAERGRDQAPHLYAHSYMRSSYMRPLHLRKFRKFSSVLSRLIRLDSNDSDLPMIC